MYKIDIRELPQSWGYSKVFCKNDQGVEAGVFQCNTGESLPMHTHDDGDEYCYLLSGKAVFVIGDSTIDVEAGELVRIPKGVLHKSFPATEEPFVSVYIVCS